MGDIRKRTRAAAQGQADVTQPTTAPPVRINKDRLHVLLSLRARGRTQADAAAYFGVDERTIRRWEQQARNMGLSAHYLLTAQIAVRRLVADLQEQQATLHDLADAAKDAGDTKQQLRCVKAQTQATMDLAKVCDRAGVFNGRDFELAPEALQRAKARHMEEWARKHSRQNADASSNKGERSTKASSKRRSESLSKNEHSYRPFR